MAKMVLVRPEDIKISNGSDSPQASVNVKTPKRVLQFCDGVLEEYSTDEEDNLKPEIAVNTSELPWGSWLWYKASTVGSGTLSVIDTLGEFFASAFGITTPRYYFELEEHKRRLEEKRKEEDEEKGWSRPATNSAQILLNNKVSEQPKPVSV